MKNTSRGFPGLYIIFWTSEATSKQKFSVFLKIFLFRFADPRIGSDAMARARNAMVRTKKRIVIKMIWASDRA